MPSLSLPLSSALGAFVNTVPMKHNKITSIPLYVAFWCIYVPMPLLIYALFSAITHLRRANQLTVEQYLLCQNIWFYTSPLLLILATAIVFLSSKNTKKESYSKLAKIVSGSITAIFIVVPAIILAILAGAHD
jgi:surface polysaccharide O-acyltransferase-like enzyme